MPGTHHPGPTAAQVIARKRDGNELNRAEIRAFVLGATDGSWPDYQLSAMLMAIFLRGMTPAETAVLTDAMMCSGSVVAFPGLRLPKVDKHSTGGVGDKVTIPLTAMVAACGAAVPMISGRGLGHTGGTLDKLEAIPGFRTDLTLDEFRAQVSRTGAAITGQTAEIAPADRKLYALRDATGTVASVPLICASILCKKLTEGAEALVLDVKFGLGAFMPDIARARELAQAMIAICRNTGTPVRAFLTRMDQPLGRSVGNALEIVESIACLRGEGPEDLMEVTFALGEQMLVLAKVAADPARARAVLRASIKSGAALAKFRELVAAQGGDVRAVDDPSLLPKARIQSPVVSGGDGVVTHVEAFDVGMAAYRLGAGRKRAGDPVDPAVGVDRLVKIGERVRKGQTLAVIHANDEASLSEARKIIEGGILVGSGPVETAPLVAEML